MSVTNLHFKVLQSSTDRKQPKTAWFNSIQVSIPFYNQDRGYFHNMSHAIVQAITAKNFKQAFQLFDNLLNGDLSGHPSYFAQVTGYKYYFNYLITQMPGMGSGRSHNQVKSFHFLSA